MISVDKKMVMGTAVISITAALILIIISIIKNSFYIKKKRMKNDSNELKLVLERDVKDSSFTLGKLSVNGIDFCYTLEDVVRSNGFKVAGQTAIPSGTYEIDMDTVSPKYSSRGSKSQYLKCENKVPRLKNVPGFDGILIHIGNYTTDTEGCLLVGTSRNTSKGTISNSTTAFWQLYEILDEAHKAGKKITITIK